MRRARGCARPAGSFAQALRLDPILQLAGKQRGDGGSRAPVTDRDSRDRLRIARYALSKFGTSILVYPDIEVHKLRYRSCKNGLRYWVLY